MLKTSLNEEFTAWLKSAKVDLEVQEKEKAQERLVYLEDQIALLIEKKKNKQTEVDRAIAVAMDEFNTAKDEIEQEVQAKKDQIFSHYIHGDNEPIYSKLGNQSALRMHLLAAIATRFVHTLDEIYSFIDSTFYAYQAETFTLRDDIDETLQFLSDNEFVIRYDDAFTATLFGNRTSSLYIDPLSGLQLRKALETSEGKENSEIGFLHAVCATPDVRNLYLRRSDSWISDEIAGIKDECLLDVPPAFSTDYEWFLGEMKTGFDLTTAFLFPPALTLCEWRTYNTVRSY